MTRSLDIPCLILFKSMWISVFAMFFKEFEGDEIVLTKNSSILQIGT